MKQLVKVITVDSYKLACTFDNGTQKISDIAPFLDTEVFTPLKNPAIFHCVKNHGYYISWLNEEIDLSADTLWYIGANIADNPSPHQMLQPA